MCREIIYAGVKLSTKKKSLKNNIKLDQFSFFNDMLKFVPR